MKVTFWIIAILAAFVALFTNLFIFCLLLFVTYAIFLSVPKEELTAMVLLPGIGICLLFVSLCWINVYMAFDPDFQKIQTEFQEKGSRISWRNPSPNLQPIVAKRNDYCNERGIWLVAKWYAFTDDIGVGTTQTIEAGALPPWRIPQFLKNR